MIPSRAPDQAIFRCRSASVNGDAIVFGQSSATATRIGKRALVDANDACE
jgi:hypothetical protein